MRSRRGRPRVLVRSRGRLDHREGVCDVVRAFDGGVRGDATKRRSNRGLSQRHAMLTVQQLICDLMDLPCFIPGLRLEFVLA